MTKQTRLFWIFLTAGALVGGAAIAIPHEFSPNQPISASQVNANFAALQDELTALRQELDESSLATYRFQGVCSNGPFTAASALDNDFVDINIAACSVPSGVLEVGATESAAMLGLGIQFAPPRRGRYRVVFRGSAYKPAGNTVEFRLNDGRTDLVGEFRHNSPQIALDGGSVPFSLEWIFELDAAVTTIRLQAKRNSTSYAVAIPVSWQIEELR